MISKLKDFYTEVMVVVNDHHFLVGIGVGVIVTLVMGQIF